MSKVIAFSIVTFLANTMLGAFVPMFVCVALGLIGVVLFSSIAK